MNEELPPDPHPAEPDACNVPNCIAHTLPQLGFDEYQLRLALAMMGATYAAGAARMVTILERCGIQIVVGDDMISEVAMPPAWVLQKAFEEALDSMAAEVH